MAFPTASFAVQQVVAHSSRSRPRSVPSRCSWSVIVVATKLSLRGSIRSRSMPTSSSPVGDGDDGLRRRVRHRHPWPQAAGDLDERTSELVVGHPDLGREQRRMALPVQPVAHRVLDRDAPQQPGPLRPQVLRLVLGPLGLAEVAAHGEVAGGAGRPVLADDPVAVAPLGQQLLLGLARGLEQRAAALEPAVGPARHPGPHPTVAGDLDVAVDLGRSHVEDAHEAVEVGAGRRDRAVQVEPGDAGGQGDAVLVGAQLHPVAEHLAGGVEQRGGRRQRDEPSASAIGPPLGQLGHALVLRAVEHVAAVVHGPGVVDRRVRVGQRGRVGGGARRGRRRPARRWLGCSPRS